MIEYLLLIYNIVIFIILTPLLIKFFRFNSIIIQFAVYILILIINTLVLGSEDLILIWISFCFFSFFVCIYIFIYGALETSISIKILNELEKKDLYIKDITDKIVKKSLFKRINILKKKNMVIRKKNKYSLTLEGFKVIKKINLIRKIFKLENLGFYK
jgi:hypothetical protein|tara:strand:+ start:184 stop:657 length:474 start_codon:yes stop_codon:yes gene_type:complete